MAKISELPQATELTGSELLPVVVDKDGSKQNKTITASSLALAIKTLEELASVQLVEETINEVLTANNYATLADLVMELSKKADTLHEHSEYSVVNHTHDFNDLTNAPDMTEYAAANDFNEMVGKLADVIAETQANTFNIEVIIEILNNLPTYDGSGGSTESSGHVHSNFAILETITLDKILKWENNNSVTKVSELENDLNYTTQSYVTFALSEYAEKSHTHTEYAEKSHTHNYNELEGKPTVPTKVSDLLDAGDYVKNTDVCNFINMIEDLVESSVSDGKALIADAITDKGVPTSNKDTFSNMADNIRKINTGEVFGEIITNVESLNISLEQEGTLKIRLSKEPTSEQNVTLDVDSENIMITPTTLSFTPSNWNLEQEVVVKCIDNDYKDSTLILTVSTNSHQKDIVLNVKNEQFINYGQIIVSTSSLSFEPKSKMTFSVCLDSAPTHEQKVYISRDDSNLILNKLELTFTPQNYQTNQTVTVESSVETSGTITLSSENVSSKTISCVVKSLQDMGITLITNEDSFSVEEGSYYTFTVKPLNAFTEGSYTANITVSDSDVYVTTNILTFTPENATYAQAVTVMPTNTANMSGRTVTLTISGNNITTKTITITILNNNTSTEVSGEIVLDTASLNLSNNTQTAQVGVTLSKAPTNNQLINIATSSNNIILNKTGLTFNSTNYNIAQYVTVSVNPTLLTAMVYNETVTFSSNNVSNKTVQVNIDIEDVEDEVEVFGNIVLETTNLTINENSSGRIRVRLESAPTNNQVVNISSLDTTVATVDKPTLTFTPLNYSTYQVVNVNGMYDSSSYNNKSTQISFSSANVSSRTAYIIVNNIDEKPSGGDSGNGDNSSSYLELEDSAVRNLVPYLATYYIEPTISTNQNVTINYFVTDYYGRSYTKNSNFYSYKVILKCDGKEDVVQTNVRAGDNSINLGSFSSEGTYHFSLIAIDQYGRESHELFNYIRVKNNINRTTYTVTQSDINSYGIAYNVGREVKQYVHVSSGSSESAITSAIQNAYNNATPSSGKYIVFIPTNNSNNTYEGKMSYWKYCKVKYASDYNSSMVETECASNRQKIQKLINDKVALGYNKIVFYNATYVIDNSPIDVPDGVDLDLNGATIKLNPFTGNGALMMRMTDCTDSALHNGTIEGDYFAHDYTNSTHNSEWVSGVEMGGSCRYCSIYDLMIKDITGYGLQNSISSTSPNGNTFFNTVKVGTMTQGDIDRETGENVSCNYRLRSERVNISAYQGNSDYISMSIHLAYQGNEFSTWNYYMYFYNSAGQFIKAVSAYQYRQVKIPSGAYYARIVILGERLQSNWDLCYHFLRVPTHCSFENIVIDNARCVGMAQGQMKDFLLNNCTIKNSGQSSATCSYDAEDGWDGMQDVFIENCRFIDCPNNGIVTCAGHNFCINNVESDKLYMWERTRWVLIKNSNFGEATIRGGGEKDILKHGIARFYNNTITGLTYSMNFVSNIMKDCILDNRPQSGLLLNCTVGGTKYNELLCNNDANNPCINDYGTMTDNVDYGQTDNGNTGGDGGNGEQVTPPTPTTTPVTSVTLNNSSLTMKVGDTQQLTATVYPTNASNKQVTWSSSKSNVATVSNGSVTAKDSGNTVITVTTSDGGYTATCNVTVEPKEDGTTTTVSPSSAILQKNVYQTFVVNGSATITTAYTASGNATISSQNKTTVTIYTLNVGTEYLNLVLSDGTYISIPITITGSGIDGGGDTGGDNDGGNDNVSSVSPTSATLKIGETQTFTITGSTIRTQYLASNNATIVDYGKASVTVQGVKFGHDYLNLILEDGSEFSIFIDVITSETENTTVPVTGVDIVQSTLNLTVNETSQLSFTIYPTNATNKGYTFNTNNTSVVSVSSSGLVTAKAEGDATITIVTSDGNYSDSVYVYVTNPSGGDDSGGNDDVVSSVSPSSATLRVGESQTFTVTGSPIRTFYLASNNATITSSNKNSITVQGVKVGHDYLNLFLEDNSEFSIFIDIINSGTGGDTTVPVTGVDIAQSTLNLTVNETSQLTFTIYPTNATNKGYTFTSYNTSVATVSSSGLVTAKSAGSATITITTNEGYYSDNVYVYVTAPSGGDNTGGDNPSYSGVTNSSDTAISQQYSSSHEAQPNNPNPPMGAYNWIYKPRINPDGSFPSSTWNAIGHWMTTYLVSGASYYDNVGLLLQNPKAWIWNTTTQSWDVLSNDFEWGTWYREDFWDDGSGNINGTTTWEKGVSANHSTWVKIKQTSVTAGRCFHPWGYQKNWRSNSNWSNNGCPYIVTKIDFKLVKYDENGVDNLDKAQLVVNSGADWWSEVGAVWQPDWSTNRDMAVGKYVLATRDLKRAWCTNLPSNWDKGLPTD